MTSLATPLVAVFTSLYCSYFTIKAIFVLNVIGISVPLNLIANLYREIVQLFTCTMWYGNVKFNNFLCSAVMCIITGINGVSKESIFDLS